MTMLVKEKGKIFTKKKRIKKETNYREFTSILPHVVLPTGAKLVANYGSYKNFMSIITVS